MEIRVKEISKRGEEFLNKHLFKEIKIRVRTEGKPQLDVDERLYSPNFRKNEQL